MKLPVKLKDDRLELSSYNGTFLFGFLDSSEDFSHFPHARPTGVTIEIFE